VVALVPLVSCAATGAGGPGGPGGASSALDARYVAVHNALASTGWSEVGPIQRASVTRGLEARLPIHLRPPCTTVVLFGSAGAGPLDAKIVDPTGKLVASAETVDASPVIKACVADAGSYTLVVNAASGGGDILAAEFAGDSGSPPPKPSNDGTCAAPFPLGEGRTAGNTSHGHAELEGSCASSQGKELVYRLELKDRKRVTVEVDPKFDAVLYLRKESCAEEESEVACNDDAGGERHSKIEEELDPGVYFVVVDGYGNESGAFKMDVTMGAAEPISLACERAPELLAGGSSPSRGAGGSITSDWSHESNHASGSCQASGSGLDAIYRWTEARTERVRFTLDDRAGEPAALFVRSSCEDADSELACAAAGTGTSPSVARLFSPGEYLVFADSVTSRPEDEFVLRTDVAPAEGSHVAGDSCGDALPLRGGETVRGDTFNARDDGPQSCGGGGAADLVYRVEVPVRSFLDVGFTGQSTTDAVLSLSRGCGSRRHEVACGDRLAVAVDPGSWFVTVDGRSKDDLGAFELHADLHDVRQQERSCASPAPLAAGKTVEGTTRGGGDGFSPSCARITSAASPSALRVGGASGGGLGSLVAPLPSVPPVVESSPDRVFRVVVKEQGVLNAQVSGDGWDPVLALRSSCLDSAREPELACSAEANQEGKRVIEASVAAGTYYLVVDGRGADSSGKFRLSYTLGKESHEVESE
jgi:hypothetical protein